DSAGPRACNARPRGSTAAAPARTAQKSQAGLVRRGALGLPIVALGRAALGARLAALGLAAAAPCPRLTVAPPGPGRLAARAGLAGFAGAALARRGCGRGRPRHARGCVRADRLARPPRLAILGRLGPCGPGATRLGCAVLARLAALAALAAPGVLAQRMAIGVAARDHQAGAEWIGRRRRHSARTARAAALQLAAPADARAVHAIAFQRAKARRQRTVV